jgi:hypothetical protein
LVIAGNADCRHRAPVWLSVYWSSAICDRVCRNAAGTAIEQTATSFGAALCQRSAIRCAQRKRRGRPTGNPSRIIRLPLRAPPRAALLPFRRKRPDGASSSRTRIDQVFVLAGIRRRDGRAVEGAGVEFTVTMSTPFPSRLRFASMPPFEAGVRAAGGVAHQVCAAWVISGIPPANLITRITKFELRSLTPGMRRSRSSTNSE